LNAAGIAARLATGGSFKLKIVRLKQKARHRSGTVGGPCRTPRVESERVGSDEVDQ